MHTGLPANGFEVPGHADRALMHTGLHANGFEVPGHADFPRVPCSQEECPLLASCQNGLL